ncbi:MAG: FtsX-like permease family protein [Planctomycetota bacterium]|nr:MAG: FtsX-like permease family protein [Planctomycetota bacterium]
MWSIALKTLISDRGKLLTALVGVVFAVALVNIQGGLFIGLLRKASLLVEHSDADIWVGHYRMHNVDFPHDIPRRWQYRIAGTPGVARAEPYLIGWSNMTLPSGSWEAVVVVGMPPGAKLGRPWNLEAGSSDALLQTDGIIVDAYEMEKIESPELNERREIGGHRAKIAAKTRGVTGFLVAPYVFTTYDRAVEYTGKSPDAASYFLVKVEPGADVIEVRDRIRARIPDAEVLTADEYAWTSIWFWLVRSPIGVGFGAATLLGLVVGTIIIAESLYTLVLDRLSEIGTLKAIGATDVHVNRLVLTQAVLLAWVGASIGLAITAAMQAFLDGPVSPIVIPWWLSMGSCALAVMTCLIASIVPCARIRRVDPLMVLQG